MEQSPCDDSIFKNHIAALRWLVRPFWSSYPLFQARLSGNKEFKSTGQQIRKTCAPYDTRARCKPGSRVTAAVSVQNASGLSVSLSRRRNMFHEPPCFERLCDACAISAIYSLEVHHGISCHSYIIKMAAVIMRIRQRLFLIQSPKRQEIKP
ncbi:hypothetical protein Bbelb_325590 [Branchiostoma belcheri]|nr:hypothetical protein Bbelb_325590 [Branchiostoma belcheri]